MITNWKYNDVALYAKGWYERTDIIKDLSYLFSKVYGWMPNEEHAEADIANFMLRIVDNLIENKIHVMFPCTTCSGLISEIKHYSSLYELSFDMATIRLVLSILLDISREDIKLNPPHFGRSEHFRLGCIGKRYPISMTYTTMNKHAQKAFKD